MTDFYTNLQEFVEGSACELTQSTQSRRARNYI